MNKREHIDKMIDEALSSIDNIKQAEAKPFLFTRINARISKGAESAWEKAGWFIGRPAVAFTGLCLILLVNAVVILNKQSISTVATDQVAQTPADEFSYTVATIYDFENAQP